MQMETKRDNDSYTNIKQTLSQKAKRHGKSHYMLIRVNLSRSCNSCKYIRNQHWIPKYFKHVLTNLKRVIDDNIIRKEDFNFNNEQIIQRINKETLHLN